MSRPRNKLQKVVNSQDIKEPSTADQVGDGRSTCCKIASFAGNILSIRANKLSAIDLASIDIQWKAKWFWLIEYLLIGRCQTFTSVKADS